MESARVLRKKKRASKRAKKKNPILQLSEDRNGEQGMRRLAARVLLQLYVDLQGKKTRSQAVKCICCEESVIPFWCRLINLNPASFKRKCLAMANGKRRKRKKILVFRIDRKRVKEYDKIEAQI